MPKVVDHAQRRIQIADATVRVLVRGGMAAASIRTIAAEAGVSSGMVQHYFKSKDDIIQFAMSVVRERGASRLSQMEQVGSGRNRSYWLTQLLTRMLPTDDDSRTSGLISLINYEHSARRGTPNAALQSDMQSLRQFIEAQLFPGEPPTAKHEALATGLIAAVEGLSMLVLAGYCTAAQAETTLSQLVSAVTSP